MEISVDPRKETTQKNICNIEELWFSDRVLKESRIEEIAQVVPNSSGCFFFFLFNRMIGPETVGRMTSGNPKHQIWHKETVQGKGQSLDLVFVMQYLKLKGRAALEKGFKRLYFIERRKI